MMRQVYKNYGPYGIYRGFTTAYYGTSVAGYVYFLIYKGMKTELKDRYKPQTQKQTSAIYIFSSILAEIVTLGLYYPYEVIKVRYIAKNQEFGYRGIADGMKKIVINEGFSGLYRGGYYFLINYVMSFTIQMSIYETYMDLKKRKWGIESFKQHENRYVIEASLLGGAFSGILMNSFECIVYLRISEQQKNKSILEIY